MPLYQMLCISTHFREYKHIKQLVDQTCRHIMNNGGVVRKIDSWGTFGLPQRMKRHAGYNTYGDYWTLHFDTSPRTLQSLNKIMRQDPLKTLRPRDEMPYKVKSSTMYNPSYQRLILCLNPFYLRDTADCSILVLFRFWSCAPKEKCSHPGSHCPVVISAQYL
ncbi:37s ribosomal protein mrp17 [Lentinula edodes]|uniref:37s ribosomal protein mrp17 n=1 Tax=Lentinula edodes TaxID=5353 RepID=A0A1Q3EE25_LENED|nr:37s ribosomal protein mrp17 [Lentinula edodes]